MYPCNVNESQQTKRQRRLELARAAFKEFSVRCFWSWPEDAEITEETIPLIVRGLRLHGGHKGYSLALMVDVAMGDDRLTARAYAGAALVLVGVILAAVEIGQRRPAEEGSGAKEDSPPRTAGR